MHGPAPHSVRFGLPACPRGSGNGERSASRLLLRGHDAAYVWNRRLSHASPTILGGIEPLAHLSLIHI